MSSMKDKRLAALKDFMKGKKPKEKGGVLDIPVGPVKGMMEKNGKKAGGMMKKKGYAMGGAMKKKGMAKGGMMKKGYAMGGAMKKKGMSKGGKLRGNGIAVRGFRAGKMVTMKGS